MIKKESKKKISEARHDGSLPRHQTRRNATTKATVYYIGIDDSDDFRGYGQYVTPNGKLTTDASNNNFRYAAVTADPEKIIKFAETAITHYGKNKFIFIFKDEHSYGTLTQKSHARPSTVDIWYPRGQYWRYNLSHVI